jgi:hypothetical protein
MQLLLWFLAVDEKYSEDKTAYSPPAIDEVVSVILPYTSYGSLA